MLERLLERLSQNYGKIKRYWLLRINVRTSSGGNETCSGRACSKPSAGLVVLILIQNIVIALLGILAGNVWINYLELQ